MISDASAAAGLGQQSGVDVLVADVTRYQAWDQAYWWQHIWPGQGLK